jgi:hypothetical protein
MGAYKGKASTIKEADEKTNGFKKGGPAKKMSGGYAGGGMAKKKAMDDCDRPARKSGGGVMSSASGHGTPRGKASHY